MLRVWRLPELRPTMDIDMLGRASNEEAVIVVQIRDVLTADVEADGLAFDPDSIQTERITEDADYEGIRIRFLGTLGSAKVNMRIDIGFGDIVYPEPEESDLPTMLNFPAPRLFCYSRERTISEKLEAMVNLGMLNSRMKEFYDIWMLSRKFDFNGAKLTEAIRLTFKRRGTKLPLGIKAFADAFIKAKYHKLDPTRPMDLSRWTSIVFIKPILIGNRFWRKILDRIIQILNRKRFCKN